MSYSKWQWSCNFDNPCSTAKKDVPLINTKTCISVCFPVFRGIPKNGYSLYKIRTIVERAIDYLKINMYVAGRKSRNHTTTKADVFFARIASQLTVIVAHSMNCPQYILNLKLLIA